MSLSFLLLCTSTKEAAIPTENLFQYLQINPTRRLFLLSNLHNTDVWLKVALLLLEMTNWWNTGLGPGSTCSLQQKKKTWKRYHYCVASHYKSTPVVTKYLSSHNHCSWEWLSGSEMLTRSTINSTRKALRMPETQLLIKLIAVVLCWFAASEGLWFM